MKLRNIIFPGIASFLLASASAKSVSVADVVAGNDNFALDLYAQFKTTDGNLFFSPYSISTCLAMTYAGARGETAKQMARVLHLPAGPSEVATPFGELQKQINLMQEKGAFELSIANGLWAEKEHPFLPGFVGITGTDYGANINQVDFKTQAEPARREINDWASAQTQGKITDLLQPGVIKTNTCLVLVNAIYFKGTWARTFAKQDTRDAPFFIGSAQTNTAKLMYQDNYFNYAEPPDCQLLELPYVSARDPSNPFGDGDHLSMVILLPREKDGLQKLEGSLTEPFLKKWLGGATGEKVKVYIPRFKMTSQFGLYRTLAAMGMRDAFSDGSADFSGMDGDHDLFISAVVHKAYVDVYEEGTEAAAATEVLMSRSAVIRESPPLVFRADHPFIFLIRDNQSGSILFLGRINDPSK